MSFGRRGTRDRARREAEHPGEPTARYARHGATIPAFPPSLPLGFSSLLAYSLFFLPLFFFFFFFRSFFFIPICLRLLSFFPYSLLFSFSPDILIHLSLFFFLLLLLTYVSPRSLFLRDISQACGSENNVSSSYIYIYNACVYLACAYYYPVTSGVLYRKRAVTARPLPSRRS